jgi:hypothetical protein
MLGRTFLGIQHQTDKIGENEIQIIEPGFEYFEIDPYERSVRIDGYRQSWKYFEEYKEQIFEDLKFHTEIEQEVKEFLDPLRILEKPIIAVQVRRGDYTTTNDFITPTKEEILNGINYMQKKYNGVFLFISDDSKWCKETFGNLKNAYFSENHSEGFDLCLMTHVDHALISSSTYGWWGMYLNPRKEKEVILFSKDWFNPLGDFKHFNTKDLIAPEFKFLKDLI